MVFPSKKRSAQRYAIGRVAAMKMDIAEGPIAERLNGIPWQRVEADLDAFGGALLEQLLTPQECGAVAAMYRDDAQFRSRVVMARHGFGRGNTNTSVTRCRHVEECGRTTCIRGWHPLPTAGMKRCGSACGIRQTMRIPPALPRGRPAPADAVAAPVWARRLQLPASGPVRRTCVSDPGGGAASRTRAGFRRR